MGWTFTLKSVRYLVALKDGKTISLVTYTPFGKNRIINVPLRYVSAQESRQTSKVYLPLKIKGRAFYYILDMKGEFKNTRLFDNTIGLSRKFWIKSWRDVRHAVENKRRNSFTNPLSISAVFWPMTSFSLSLRFDLIFWTTHFSLSQFSRGSFILQTRSHYVSTSGGFRVRIKRFSIDFNWLSSRRLR